MITKPLERKYWNFCDLNQSECSVYFTALPFLLLPPPPEIIKVETIPCNYDEHGGVSGYLCVLFFCILGIWSFSGNNETHHLITEMPAQLLNGGLIPGHGIKVKNNIIIIKNRLIETLFLSGYERNLIFINMV